MEQFHKSVNAVFALFFWIVAGIILAYFVETQMIKIISIIAGIILGLTAMIYYLLSIY